MTSKNCTVENTTNKYTQRNQSENSNTYPFPDSFYNTGSLIYWQDIGATDAEGYWEGETWVADCRRS